MAVAEPDVFDLDGGAPWERRPREVSNRYAAFRLYRDQPAHRRNLAEVASEVGISVRRAREWAVQGDWRVRAEAWDEACHRVEDRERLEAIREMHTIHRRAGRAAITKALQALSLMDPVAIPAGTTVRLLELGARLERSTLIVSVEDLQGVEVDDEAPDDPWERIAAELEPGGS